MNKRILPWAALLLILTLLLAACSNSGSNDRSEPSPAQTQNESSPSSSSSEPSEPEAAFPRTIYAANGDVTIEKQPEKVAVVHWGYTDSILLFDLKSVGFALPFTEKQSVLHTETYKPYTDRLDELVIVGENTTVNMEELLAYDPDVIIAGNSVNQDIVESLEKMATTVVLDEQKTDIWSDWPSVVTEFGNILGQEEIAANYIADFQTRLQDAKEKLAGVEGTVAFLQIRAKESWLQGTNYLQTYYEGLGLKAPDSAEMADGAQISLEGLSQLDPDHLFLGQFNVSDPSLPALSDEWKQSGVWSKLKAVQNGQVYDIDGNLALAYGPLGRSYGIQAVLDALSK
ncbi:ABC transporter substrate-binding protein [Paenibacillaceae bacterium WGS1546]|uniref:ABC transporter substrate-binding protein n=1 Tax=Cohnella sp. WGS1546 TaxID=3366810 RepID=UPI00372D2AB2